MFNLVYVYCLVIELPFNSSASSKIRNTLALCSQVHMSYRYKAIVNLTDAVLKQTLSMFYTLLHANKLTELRFIKSALLLAKCLWHSDT